MVVELHPEDLPQAALEESLGMLHLLEALESRCWQAGGGRLVAPAQRMTDFLSGTLSKSLLPDKLRSRPCSADLSTVFPRSFPAPADGPGSVRRQSERVPLQ
jgi:uncharacterized FAD-dependent dehydrogenase